MHFMLVLFAEREGPEDPSVFGEMGQFAGRLAGQGKLLGGAPLKPEVEGVRIRAEGASVRVTDGPFAETKEVIGGYFVIECETRDEALEIARTCPHARVGAVEVREIIQLGRGGD